LIYLTNSKHLYKQKNIHFFWDYESLWCELLFKMHDLKNYLQVTFSSVYKITHVACTKYQNHECDILNCCLLITYTVTCIQTLLFIHLYMSRVIQSTQQYPWAFIGEEGLQDGQETSNCIRIHNSQQKNHIFTSSWYHVRYHSS
jgi:hypothetical protein